MELRQLRDFMAVVKAGSFAAASRKLNMSQPGLGYQIKQLELELGTSLLVRHSRGIELTPIGSIFATDAERILALVGEARLRVKELVHGQPSEIRIGLSPTPEHLLASSLAQLNIQGRDIRVLFREGLSEHLLQEVREGALDAAICIVTHPLADLRSIPLYAEHLHLIGPRTAESGEGPIALADLGAFPLMTGPPDHLPRRLLDEEAARRKIGLNIVQELEPGRMRRALVLDGNAWTVATQAMFIDEIEAGVLTARRIVEPSIALDVRMACAPALSASFETALLSVVRAAAAAHPGALELAADTGD